MENIDRKIAVWKNKLLDLGKRNKLINYKHSTKSSLIITFPSYEDLFDSLVRNECSLDFPRPHDSDDEESNELQMSLWEDNGHSLGYPCRSMSSAQAFRSWTPAQVWMQLSMQLWQGW